MEGTEGRWRKREGNDEEIEVEEEKWDERRKVK